MSHLKLIIKVQSKLENKMLLLLMIYVVTACPSQDLSGGNISTTTLRSASSGVKPPRNTVFPPGPGPVPPIPPIGWPSQGPPVVPVPVPIIPGQPPILPPTRRPTFPNYNQTPYPPHPPYTSYRPGVPSGPYHPTKRPPPRRTTTPCPTKQPENLKAKNVALKSVLFNGHQNGELTGLNFKICNEFDGLGGCCFKRISQEKISKEKPISFPKGGLGCREFKVHTMPKVPYISFSYDTDYHDEEKMSLKTLEFIMTSNYKIVCAAPCEGIQFDGTKKIFDKEGDCVWTYLKS